jgi:MoxR-like ATPase
VKSWAGTARTPGLPTSVDGLIEVLGREAYLADRGLATAVFLGISLGRPILLEGEPGVGKTEMAKALAAAFESELIRLQCYEGIDANQALYEWDYTRQLLYVRALSEKEASNKEVVSDLFGPEFLVERPLLKATRMGERAVLLVDEIDRADDEFEAFLLEVLSDFQVTIPEIGTIRAEQPPIVIITSNRTRELHDALKRRCLYHWIDYPNPQREVEIVQVRAPEVPGVLARKVVDAVTALRQMDLVKRPGLAETIDWARALEFLGADDLDATVAEETLGSVIKDHDDYVLVRKSLGEVVR